MIMMIPATDPKPSQRGHPWKENGWEEKGVCSCYKGIFVRVMINDHISLKKDKPGDKLGSSKTFWISRGMPEHLLLVHINLEKNINLEQKLLFSLSNLRKALKSRSWWLLSKKSPTTKDFCSRELRMAKVKVAGTGVVCLSHLRVIFHYDSISILLNI